MKQRIALVFCLLLMSVAAHAEIYRWRDANGTVQYSDRKPEQVEAETVAVQAQPPPTAMAHPPATAPVAAPEAPESAVGGVPVSIVMYQSPKCGWCRKAERFLAGRGVSWRSVDITASRQAKQEFERQGGRGTPLIFIEDQRISGFNEGRLDAALAAYGW